MTISAGARGLILSGSPPRSAIASRMVAMSTTQGTPVKSCMMTRAGVNWISMSGSAPGSQFARERMWSAVMFAPSSVRIRFSSRTFSENGQLARVLQAVQPDDPVDVVALVTDGQGVLGGEAVLAGGRHGVLLASGGAAVGPRAAVRATRGHCFPRRSGSAHPGLGAGLTASPYKQYACPAMVANCGGWCVVSRRPRPVGRGLRWCGGSAGVGPAEAPRSCKWRPPKLRGEHRSHGKQPASRRLGPQMPKGPGRLAPGALRGSVGRDRR